MTGPLTPGGTTEQAKNAGGEALESKLALLLSGERPEVVLYALTVTWAKVMAQLTDTDAEAGAWLAVLGNDTLDIIRSNPQLRAVAEQTSGALN